MKLKAMIILAGATMMVGCPLRPPVLQLDSYAKATNSGVIVFEQFEDGPMEFWLSAKRISDGKVLLFSQGGDSKFEHPNFNFSLDGKYLSADTSYHMPRAYEVQPGKYIIYQAALRGPAVNSQIESNFNLQPDTFEVVSQKATYIGSFNLYADRGIPLISPQKISMSTTDKFDIIEKIMIAKEIAAIRDLVSLKRK